MKSEHSQRSLVRRTDARLRAAQPHIETQIYEINPYHHVIVASREDLDATAFAEQFDKSFSPINVRVEFRNDAPEGATLVESIADSELARGFEGFHLPRLAFETCLAGLFPSAPGITALKDRAGGVLEVRFSEAIPLDMETGVRKFLFDHLGGRQFEICVGPSDQEAETPKANPAIESLTALDFRPIRRRPQVPEFVAEEEAWWFQNLSGLCSGDITPESFDLVRDAGSACYIHGTAFPCIDIRQAVLAFDTVYLEPPLLEQGGSSEFWKSQTISRDDLLCLVAADRVRLIHSQPEERSDLGFLREAHESNPNGVVGRRVTAALMVADIVRTADEYLLGPSSDRRQIKDLVRHLTEESKLPVTEVACAILYPDFMRRACVEALHSQGLMGVSVFSQGRLLSETMKRLTGKDTTIESYLFGQAVHTAHTLNATYIPHTSRDGYVGSWIGPAQLMGDRLNFYRSLNTRIAAAWAENERDKREERRIILPPVPLLEFDRNASIKDVLDFTSLESVRRKGRSLISRLANLPQEERDAEIGRIEKELYEFGAKRDRRREAVSLLDATVSVTDYVMSASLFPVVAGWHLFQSITAAARRAPTLDRLLDKLERETSGFTKKNEDLDFLSKISRVAHLRRSQ